MKKCLKCGKEWQDDFNFCPVCREALQGDDAKCPDCGKSLYGTFCPVCGKEFPVFTDSVLDLGLDAASIDAAMSQGTNLLKMEPIPGMMKYKVTGCINEYVTEIEIPETVHVIGKGAFEGLQYLKKVTISSSVQIIEDEAFAECPNLKIAIPEGIICGKDVIRGTKTDNDRIARERAEAERKAREKAEAERKAREKAEAERKAKEEAERKAREKAEAERKAKAEAERKAREAEEARKRAEAERKAREAEEARKKAEAAKPKKTAQGTVLFGNYSQGSNGEVKPIEWKILKREGSKALLISKYGLDAIPYNTKYEDVTWENCTLRKWLNGTFLNQAFNGEEQKNILQTQVSAHKNPKCSANPGNATTDKVFLLSIPEANDYFKSDEDRSCAPTAYAKAQGAYTSKDYKTADGEATCFWWLRSPGDSQASAAGVCIVGSVRYIGNSVHVDDDAVRPALWVNLES